MALGIMRFVTLLTLSLGPALVAMAAEDAKPLRLVTNIAPPYQMLVNGKLGGSSTEALDCIMKAMNVPYEVEVAPWPRAREQVRVGTMDGFFSVAPESEPDADGRLSQPLALERWLWVIPADSQITSTGLLSGRPDARVGAVMGSNQLKWLQRNQFTADDSARSATQLLRMLAGGRLQAVLMDEAGLTLALTEAGIPPENVKTSFQKYAPLGVYFSAQLLQQKPGFLKDFNDRIGACAAANFQLPDRERAEVERDARRILEKLRRDPELIDAITGGSRQHAGLTKAELLEQDRLYLAQLQAGDGSIVKGLREAPASKRLTDLLKMEKGIVGELMAFDRSGLTIAAAHLPSDYWQGDESKFTRTVAKGANALFIDTIAFDQSSGLFLVQVSLSVTDPDSGEVIGGLTIGLDVEHALIN